jgi:hypothetical protein
MVAAVRSMMAAGLRSTTACSGLKLRTTVSSGAESRIAVAYLKSMMACSRLRSRMALSTGAGVKDSGVLEDSRRRRRCPGHIDGGKRKV